MNQTVQKVSKYMNYWDLTGMRVKAHFGQSRSNGELKNH
jgi:hypothetical protein